MPLSLPPLRQPLSPSERFAATLCFAVAALMCGTACFNTYINTMPSKPVEAPSAPRVDPSAGTLKPGAYRFGISGDYAEFSEPVGESTGQAALGARLGIALEGLELDAGLAVPYLLPYGLMRYQLLGKDRDLGTLLSVEFGGGIGDAFGGLAVGSRLNRYFEVVADGRGGSYLGRAYGESGLGLVFHPSLSVDLIAGAGYRYYGSSLQPNAARAGLSFEFGKRTVSHEQRDAIQRAFGDPAELLRLGALKEALETCEAQLKVPANAAKWELWEVYARILTRLGERRESGRARRRSNELKDAANEGRGASSDAGSAPKASHTLPLYTRPAQ